MAKSMREKREGKDERARKAKWEVTEWDTHTQNVVQRQRGGWIEEKF